MSDVPSGQDAAELETIVAGVVDDLGYDLESLDVQRAGGRRVVRVVVDRDSGVGLDEIAEASRAVSSALDERESVLAGPYTLEVTSPGVDRPLTRPRHWRRARHRLVRTRLAEGGELTGRVGEADDEGVTLLVDGSLRRLAFHEVERAVVEVEFRQPPVDELKLLDLGGAADDGAAPEQGPSEERPK
ncbi:ribosome maturation factor RimP [Actinoalloteichus sp. AHMU CJ021]|uniref:Ribosome maturation factor RimP n=2 Tax=Actinoalloteichus cyanogriseus TaxID=2893586 RepID=A0ABT1JPH4_ACTCY|nr:ribosome maturation factor RimP [Actinoalloteichus caeruleus]AUS81888.1 ribosome maturation factor RimP [Actinoalloteichus sp. AHMU CJ021]MCP2334419.1 ribosome maturation factor RimP [Actinoalloteichus caeruleus DSM 43889]